MTRLLSSSHFQAIASHSAPAKVAIFFFRRCAAANSPVQHILQASKPLQHNMSSSLAGPVSIFERRKCSTAAGSGMVVWCCCSFWQAPAWSTGHVVKFVLNKAHCLACRLVDMQIRLGPYVTWCGLCGCLTCPRLCMLLVVCALQAVAVRWSLSQC